MQTPEAQRPVTKLVSVAHGTRHAAGNEVARELTTLVDALLPIPAAVSFVELSEPLLTDVMRGLDGPSVVVPLLLSTGFHVRHDLPAAVALSPAPVAVAPPLGPDPLIARVQVLRLLLAGAEPGQDVVMVAAGSQDPEAVADLELAREHLAQAWGGEVRLAAWAGEVSRPRDVIRSGDVVSPYLLAEGHFADRAREDGAAAELVAPVLGPHPWLAELIIQRAEQALGARLRPVEETK